MIDIVTNNVRQIGTPADEGRVYISEKAYKRIKTEGFKEKEMLGMMLYIDNFAGNLKGVERKLPYLKECNVNCVHLMPFLDTPKGKSDGGYAVADFRKVRPDLGTDANHRLRRRS